MLPHSTTFAVSSEPGKRYVGTVAQRAGMSFGCGTHRRSGLCILRSPMAPFTRVGAGLLFLPLLVGCWSVGGQAKDVAERIRGSGSEVVDSVIYNRENWLDPASVDVYLRAGTTDEQASNFWCTVVVPAGGTEDFVFLSYRDETGGSGYTTVCAP